MPLLRLPPPHAASTVPPGAPTDDRLAQPSRLKYRPAGKGALLRHQGRESWQEWEGSGSPRERPVPGHRLALARPGSVVDLAPLSQPLRPLGNWGPLAQPKAQLLRADLPASSLGKAVIVPSLEPKASLTFQMIRGDFQNRSCPSPAPILRSQNLETYSPCKRATPEKSSERQGAARYMRGLPKNLGEKREGQKRKIVKGAGRRRC